MTAVEARNMTISTITLVNGALALLLLAALARVFSLGLRIHHRTNEESIVPAEPTPHHLYDDLREAA